MTGIQTGLKVLLSAVVAGTITSLTGVLAAQPGKPNWTVVIVGGLLTCLKDLQSLLSPDPTQQKGHEE